MNLSVFTTDETLGDDIGQSMTFVGTGTAFALNADAQLERAARQLLLSNGWGVESVSIRSTGSGVFNQVVNIRIVISGPCPANQPHSTIAAAIEAVLSDSSVGLSSVRVRFDRANRECTTDDGPGYVYDAGHIADVTVHTGVTPQSGDGNNTPPPVDDKKPPPDGKKPPFDLTAWLKEHETEAFLGAAILVVALMRR